MRRIASIAVSAALLAGVAALAYWAGTNAVVPPELPAESHAYETYRVAVGSVGRAVRVPVAASWPTTRTLYAGTDGVVTAVPHRAGDHAAAGAVLLTVDLRPVVVAAGAVPMFRTLKEGTAGPDVAQFQELLRTLGFLAGPADGRFGAVTAAATKRWQRSVGAAADGVVPAGALLFVETLPARLAVLAVVGERIGAGAALVRVLAARPDFSATVAASQRAELASGLAVAIAAPGGGSWAGRLGSFEALDDGRYRVALSGELCGDGCEAIPVDGETALSGRLELVPETSGVVVPTSALVQQPSGEPAVTLADGGLQAVRVVAEADGFAVVEGLAAGTVIRLPAPPGA